MIQKVLKQKLGQCTANFNNRENRERERERERGEEKRKDLEVLACNSLIYIVRNNCNQYFKLEREREKKEKIKTTRNT